MKAIAVDGSGTSPVTTSYIQIDSATEHVSRSGLQFWIKSDNGLITSSGDVEEWKDVSGNNKHAFQATSANQPSEVTNAINGLPAVSFSGSSQFLQIPSGFADFTRGTTVFVVFKPPASTPSQPARILDFGNGSNTDYSICLNQIPWTSGIALNTFTTFGSSAYIASTDALTPNAYQLIEFNLGGTAFGQLLKNGELKTQSLNMSAVNNSTRTTNFLGQSTFGGNYFTGEVAEVLLYNRSLNASEIKFVESYLFSRYALAVNPPVITPSDRVFSSTPQVVTIIGDPGSTCYFTVNGSTPTTSSTQYTGSFNINATTEVKAIAVNNGMTSAVSTALLQYDTNATNVVRSGLKLWLRAENGATTTGGGSSVVRWEDISGNSNSAYQIDAGRYPTLVSNAVNGLPAISFNGSSQSLQLPSGFADFSDGMSIILVTKPTGLSTYDARILDLGVDGGNIILSETTDTRLSFWTSSSGSWSATNSDNGISMGTYQLMESIYNGSNTGTLYTNGWQGGQNTSMITAPNIIRGRNFIGRRDTTEGWYFQGEIAELLLYDRDITTGEREDLEQYLASRYALTPPAPKIGTGMRLFGGSTSVALSSSLPSTIRYTTDGSTPGPSSTEYTSPISVTSTSTIKAIAIQPIGTSAVTSEFIQIDPDAANVLSIANRMMWIKADNGVEVAGPSDPGVKLWKEITGQGLDPSQSTSSAQPTFLTSDVNGLPAVSFDGSNDFLQIPAGFANLTPGASIFAVCKPSAGALLDLGNSGNNDVQLRLPNSTDLTFSAYNGTSTSSLTATGAIASATYQLVEAIHDGASDQTATIATDGVQDAYGPINGLNNVTRSDNFMGKLHDGTSFLNGPIAELIVFNRPLNTQEKLYVRGYFSKRYGLTTPPPVISPGTGVYTQPPAVTLSSIPGATTKYTLNGSTPGPGSNTYSSAIALTDSATVKAISIQNSINSPVATAHYQADPAAQPVPRTGLKVWLKSDYGVVASGSNVTNWINMVSSGGDAHQATGANQPTLVEDAIQERPAIRFDGSNDFLQLGQIYSPSTSGGTIVAVTRPSSLATNATIADFGNGAANNNVMLQEADASGGLKLRIYNGSSDSSVTASGALTVGQFSAQQALQDGAGSATIFTNGTQTGSGSTNNIANVVRTENFVGQQSDGTNFYAGDLAELLFYDRQLTVAERSAVSAYLVGRYQTLSVVPSAPVFSVSTSTLASPIQLGISADADCVVRITRDGSTPTSGSEIYTSALNINYTQTIKAIAIRNGISSGVTSATYTLDATKYPAPDPGDTTAPKIHLQLPTFAIPQ